MSSAKALLIFPEIGTIDNYCRSLISGKQIFTSKFLISDCAKIHNYQEKEVSCQRVLSSTVRIVIRNSININCVLQLKFANRQYSGS